MVLPRIVRYVPLATLLVALPIGAQSARPFSVQASYLRVALSGDGLGDVAAANGAEAQLRYTRGRWSLGGGVEYSRHGVRGEVAGLALRRVGPFVEPRLIVALPANNVAAYVAGRLAVTRVTALIPGTVTNFSAGAATGATLNAGGGLLIRLTPRLNFDLGASGGFSSFGSVTFPSGPKGESIGSGTNLILRAGLNVGL